jgi:ribosome-associated toxin RatA of RatAB toxin-antitoxin module
MGMNPELEMSSIAPNNENLDEDLALLEADAEDALRAGVTVSTDRLGGRRRQISAQIYIPHSQTQIWQILTDYDRLADFIPSLAKSQRLPQFQEQVRIEQIGAEVFLKFKFRARVVLDMVEHYPHQIDFKMVEGDFKEFVGAWQLKPVSGGTELCYTVAILPPLAMPVSLIERRLRSGLVMNLSAIRDRASQQFPA